MQGGKKMTPCQSREVRRMPRRGLIHIGIGGWDFDPWRGTFYPPGLAKTKQLHHASRRLTAIEINATFYKLQKPELFERWAADTPDDFVFALKASRYCTNRKALGEAGEAIERFCGQGITRLGPKLGPILWQLAATKKFDPDEIAAFLALLPREQEGLPLRHAVEASHESFRDDRFAALARGAGVAICLVDTGEGVPDPDPSAPFVYARLKASREEEPDGYAAAELDQWADRAATWSKGGRETFLFVISGAKVRAPAAAEALIVRTATERRR
jgi:uncharacterized protein YecE (DUF72 family)